MTRAGVENQIHAATGETGAGTIRDPGIFADLEAEPDAANVEHEIADRDLPAIYLHSLDLTFGPRLEPTGFVMESVPRQVLLRDQSGDFSVCDYGDSVEDTAFKPDGEANCHDDAFAPRSEREERPHRLLPDFRREKHVFASVTRD